MYFLNVTIEIGVYVLRVMLFADIQSSQLTFRDFSRILFCQIHDFNVANVWLQSQNSHCVQVIKKAYTNHETHSTPK